jgi:Mn-dependent DtxR family transcriptional regulator
LLTIQITRDDILGMMFRFHELAPAGSPPIRAEDLHGALKIGFPLKLAVWDLLRRKHLRRSEDGYHLTESGLDDGRALVRSHRLWESYLCDKLGVCAADVHHQAHQLEHFTDPLMQSELDRTVGHPVIDPHEREIPALTSAEKDD